MVKVLVDNANLDEHVRSKRRLRSAIVLAGLLHTEPEHRKQGLAKAVVTDLVAKLRAEGFAEPYFYVSFGDGSLMVVSCVLCPVSCVLCAWGGLSRSDLAFNSEPRTLDSCRFPKETRGVKRCAQRSGFLQWLGKATYG